MSEAKLFAPLYKLLSGIPMPKLRGEWQKLAREDRSTTGLSTQEVVSVLRPYNAGVADELEHTKQCLWLFKQIDSRGGGSLEWADFVKFIMTLTMETGGLAGDDGAINAEASRRAFQPLGLELAEEFARGVAECTYHAYAIDRLLVVQHGSEQVHMIAPITSGSPMSAHHHCGGLSLFANHQSSPRWTFASVSGSL